MSDYLIKKCPHCNIDIIIFKCELNCRIFRCGLFKSNLQQINPHAPKEICDKLLADDLIYGCAKPFRITDSLEIEPCEYI